MMVKTASASDQASVMGILTLAFSADPMARWSIPDPAKYLAIFSSLAKAFGGSAFETKTAYITDGFTSVWEK